MFRPPSTRIRVLPALADAGNHQRLREWLQQLEGYEPVAGGQDALGDAEFDVCILDEPALCESVSTIAERRTAEGALLPVLLVCSASDFETLVPRLRRTIEYDLWEVVDELLTTPIEQFELAIRLESLRRRRAQSIELEQKTDQLLLLNRITRHDIRNEMNVVTGWTTELEDHVDEEGEQIRQRLHSSSRHVVELTRDVRDFVDAMEVVDAMEMDGEPELTPIDLHELLTEEHVRRQTTFEDAEFRLETVPRVHVRADSLLSSVFRNLLNNAVQHNTADDPLVEVSLEEHDETIVVTIADNGPGIPPPQRDAVLGRTPEGLEHPSAGVGLYLVDMLVGRYGGEVRIADSAHGGTAVHVRLQKEPGADGDPFS